MLSSMGRPSKEASSPSAFVPALLRFLMVAGADAALLTAQTGLEEASVEADEVSVTLPRGLLGRRDLQPCVQALDRSAARRLPPQAEVALLTS